MSINYSIRSIERAAEILNCFTLHEPEKTLKQLADESGLHKSTVFRIMETLENIAWIRKDPKTGAYRIGFGIFELGTRAVSGIDFYNASLPHLERLVKITEQSAHLVINDHGEALYLNKVEAPGSLITQPSQIGLRFPMHCTAVGKVLLSNIGEVGLDQIIAEKGMKKLTHNTISNKGELLVEINKIRDQGYAIDNEEIQPGLRCVAAPIKDYTNKVVAAISVSGLVSNMSDETIPFVIGEIVDTADKISSDLGCRNYKSKDYGG